MNDTVKVLERTWTLALEEEFGHADVTGEIAALVDDSQINSGLVAISLVGSTGAVTTIEYESGALADLRQALERVAPTGVEYQHDRRWGDGNGFSHVRSALLKTSITVPVIGGHLALGTWQQIVVINLDNRPRNREIVGVVTGI